MLVAVFAGHGLSTRGSVVRWTTVSWPGEVCNTAGKSVRFPTSEGIPGLLPDDLTESQVKECLVEAGDKWDVANEPRTARDQDRFFRRGPIACSVRLPWGESALQGSKRWGMLQHDRRGPPVPSGALLAGFFPRHPASPARIRDVRAEGPPAHACPQEALGGSPEKKKKAPLRQKEACENNTWAASPVLCVELPDARREVRRAWETQNSSKVCEKRSLDFQDLTGAQGW